MGNGHNWGQWERAGGVFHSQEGTASWAEGAGAQNASPSLGEEEQRRGVWTYKGKPRKAAGRERQDQACVLHQCVQESWEGGGARLEADQESQCSK